MTYDDLRETSFAALAGMAARRAPGLFGDDAGFAVETYRASLIGDASPSFWLEAPLAGEPGFDLHVYYDRGQVGPQARFAAGCGFGMQSLFDWYFGRETGGVGVGFAHDLRDGGVATGAYVNFNRHPLHDLRGFFQAMGAPGLLGPAEALMGRLPGSWSPWYIGLFPGRAGSGARVGSFVGRGRQEAYARDEREIARNLAQAGFAAFDGEMLSRVRALAALPYQLELQLDGNEKGTGDVLGMDLTLSMRSSARVREAFAPKGAAAKACRMLQEWGVADGRWKAIVPASFCRMVPIAAGDKSEAMVMSCLPAFIKAKWSATEPQDAKVYLQCTARCR